MSSLLRYKVHWHCRSIDVKVTQIAMSPSAKPETDSKETKENSSKRKNYVTSIDKSQAQRGFLHHLAVWIWIGWIFFYFVLFGTLPFLYFYAPTFLTAVVWIMIFSAFMPIDERCQPKVTTVNLLSDSV